MMTWKQLGLHDRPVGLFNVEGYYNHFLDWASPVAASGVCMFYHHIIYVSVE